MGSQSLSDPRLLAHKPGSGVTTWFHYDDADQKFTLETVQDIKPILEDNQYENLNVTRGWKGEFHHVARVPNVVIEQLRKDGILQDRDRLKAWLNDPDNKCFRTKPGHL